MKNFLAWGALGLSLLLLPSPALPQSLSRAQLSAQNNQYFYSNGQGKITGPIVNSMNGNIISSMGVLGDTNAWTGGNSWGGGSTFNGSSTFNGLTTFAGQVNGISFISGWYNPTLSPYTAKCDGVTDDAAALNTFFAAVPANSGVYFPPGKVCVFKSPLTLPAQNHVTLEFNNAQLLYSGASQTSTLVSWGTSLPNSCSLSQVQLDNLWVNSTTTMTSGDAVVFNNLCLAHITGLVVDPAVGSGSPNTFWNGVHVNGGGNIYISNYHFKGQNIDEIVNGSTGTQLTDLFHFNGTLANGGGIGLNIAGRCGGCYWDSTDVVNNTTGNVLIDQSQIPWHNNQIRFGPNFAADGTPGYGVKISDLGQVPGWPITGLVATNSWLANGTVPIAACPGAIVAGTYLFDNTLVPPRSLGTISTCVAGVITLTGSGAVWASAGATDSLLINPGPGPGRAGIQFFCEGCWISTATGDCLDFEPNVDWEIHLVGARIENCGGAGIHNKTNQSRMYVVGGAIAQNVGGGIKNDAAGAHIELQARPSLYGNTGNYTGTAGLSPTRISGCGGVDSQVFGDDWDALVNWGTTGETTCVLAFSFAHDNIPQFQTATPNVNNTSWHTGAGTSGTTFNFNANMTTGQTFGAHMSGLGY